MPIALTLSPANVDGSASNFIFAVVQLTFSGSYPAGGDTLDLTTITDKLGSSQIVNALADSNASLNTAFGQVGGYYVVRGDPSVTPGQASPVPTALNAWKLKLFNAGGTELNAGAYPASVTGDSVVLLLTARKLL